MMDTPDPPRSAISEDELHALVDGRLAPEAAAALRLRLAADPEATTTAAAWGAQREALRALYGPIAESPLPASLVAAAEHAQKVQTQAAQWWRWGGMAAAVLLAFGVGWFSGGRWDIAHGGFAATGASQARHFAQQAAVAHAVFQPEVRHPVEVTAAQQEHLVQWLSKRLNRPLKVPVLTAQGYELVGGRLLPGDEGARAQFMYQNAAGQRITLYLGALKPGSSDGNATAFSFLDSGSVPGFYWVDHGFGYAIEGQLPRAALHELASAVYAQL
jgi:anti-sigma factor RsiW